MLMTFAGTTLVSCTLAISAPAEVQLSEKEYAAVSEAMIADNQCLDLNDKWSDEMVKTHFDLCQEAEKKWFALMNRANPLVFKISVLKQAEIMARTARYSWAVGLKFLEGTTPEDANFFFNDACVRLKAAYEVKGHFENQTENVQRLKAQIAQWETVLVTKIGMNCEQLVKAMRPLHQLDRAKGNQVRPEQSVNPTPLHRQ